MDETPSEQPQKPSHRRLWLAFWFVFLTTPFLAIGILIAMQGTRSIGLFPVEWMFFGTLIVGVLTAGFLLARLTTRTIGIAMVATVLYGLGICAVYAFIVYAGCAIVLKR